MMGIRKQDFVIVKHSERFKIRPESVFWDILTTPTETASSRLYPHTATGTLDGQSRYALESPLRLRA